MMKKLAAISAIALSALALVPSVALAGAEQEHAWGDGSVVTVQITHSASPSHAPETPEYVIAPVDAQNPLNPVEDGFGPYDLAVQLPASNGGSYSSNFRVFLVLPAEGAPPDEVSSRLVQAGDDQVSLAYAADLGQGLVPLTSFSRVQQAESLGLVDLADTGISEVCHVVRR
jgi:hypothetical protein